MRWHATVLLAGFGVAAPVAAQSTITNRKVTFDEYAFPTATTTMTGGTAYNLFSDATGAGLSANNGDFNDLYVNFANSGPGALSTSGTPNLQYQKAGTPLSGRFTSNRGFNGAAGSTNPGTRVWTAVTMLFSSHLTVTDLAMQFSSLNTAGITWETSMVGFLKPDGTLFSALPTVNPYLTHTAVNGLASTGWVMMDSKGTVNGVGTATTTSGANGSQDGGAFLVNYANAGLAAGTEVGGFIWYSMLDDVRGPSSATTSNFTASLSELTFSGVIITTIPEPGSVLLAAGAALLGFARSRRRTAGGIA